eukprot:TRINITY_DN3059_c0_g1_i1.p1 TRINITY_DN3059_c0_g1~~TRINITY_DN3059_c0_g1_i1.p1  ORF type:complete len:626 (-),score=136.34 TRINITY_DN3059_c0_g1_i1:34-1875(-)
MKNFSFLCFSLVIVYLVLFFDSNYCKKIDNNAKIPKKCISYDINSSIEKKTQFIRMYVGLSFSDKDWLNEMFYNVSDIYHTDYGKYVSLKKQNDIIIGPNKEHVNNIYDILKWLLKNNDINNPSTRVIYYGDDQKRKQQYITELSNENKREQRLLLKQIIKSNWIVVDMNIENIEMLLNTKIAKYICVENDKSIYKLARNAAYYIEDKLNIDYIAGIDHIPMIHYKEKAKLIDSDYEFLQFDTPPEGLIVTPQVLRTKYNISTEYINNNTISTTQCVSEFEEQFYSVDDLHTFLSNNNLPVVNVSVQYGFNNNSVATGEGNLDTQFVLGVSPYIPLTVITLEINPFTPNNTDPFLEWLTFVLTLSDIPDAFSTSYGDDEKYMSDLYLDRVSLDLQRLGTAGKSMIFSSGDYGVGCTADENTRYVAHFPASSSYVTSVGATLAYPTTNGTEFAIHWSGGGFSNYFPRPDYQKEAVDYYLNTNKNLPDPSYYNASNRAYPDVAFYGNYYEIIENGHLDYIGGTSASTPAFTGMISLLNQIRLNNNLPTMGFLNPFLYQTFSKSPNVFNNIKVGNNGNFEYNCTGFFCEEGSYSPVTGLGSIDFGLLVEKALAFKN